MKEIGATDLLLYPMFRVLKNKKSYEKSSYIKKYK